MGLQKLGTHDKPALHQNSRNQISGSSDLKTRSRYVARSNAFVKGVEPKVPKQSNFSDSESILMLQLNLMIFKPRWCGAQKWMTNLVYHDLLEWIVVLGDLTADMVLNPNPNEMRCKMDDVPQNDQPSLPAFLSASAFVKPVNLRKLSTEALQLLMRICNDDRRAIIK